MATFLTLYNRVMDDVDGDQATQLQSGVTVEMRKVKNYLNQASLEVWNRLNKRNEAAELKTTLSLVADTESYAIPATLYVVQMIKVQSTEPPIRIVPWTEYEMLYKPTTIVSSGIPGVCAIYSRTIYFHPTPDTAYTADIWGMTGHTAMSADADEPALHDDLHDVVYHFALAYYLDYQNDPRAMRQIQKAEQMLKVTKARIRRHNQLAPRMMSEDEFQRGEEWRRT